MAPTTADVRDAFDSLRTAETETSDLADGIRVAVHEDEAGQFFATMRRNNFDAQSRRVGETIVAHIEAEQEEGLGSLFG